MNVRAPVFDGGTRMRESPTRFAFASIAARTSSETSRIRMSVMTTSNDI